MGKNGLIGLALSAVHRSVDGVGNDAGIVGIRGGIEGLVIALLPKGGLPLQIDIFYLIIGVILKAQCGIHENTALDPGRLAPVLHAVADLRGAVLRRAGVDQRDGLHKGQIPYRPKGMEGAVFLRDGDRGAVGVLTAEDVFLGLPLAGHTEGGKGGVVLVIGKDQMLFVVELIDLIAFHGADAEAACLFRHGHFNIAVAQLTALVGLQRMNEHGAQTLQKGGRRKACDHSEDDQEGKDSFRA